MENQKCDSKNIKQSHLLRSNLVLITGTMFAGKTSKILDIVARLENYLIVTHSLDTRYSNSEIVAHNGIKQTAKFCSDGMSIKKLYDELKPNYLLIDETQFFTLDDINIIINIPCHIYLAGLDRDFRKQYFPSTQYLLSIVPVNNQIHLRTLCECGNVAIYTELNKYVNNHNGGNIIIGSDIYSPKCETCHKIINI